MKQKMLKRIIAIALSVTLVMAIFVPAASARVATWQDVLDTGLFIAIKGHGAGNPTLTATSNGLVVGNRGDESTAYGEHDGFGINLTALRALSGVDNPTIIISGTIAGEAEQMIAQFFDGRPGDGRWIMSEIGEDGSFTMNLTQAIAGVPAWAGEWGTRPWIGAHPRGNITISSIMIGGESLIDMLTAGVVVPEEPALDLGMPSGVVYSLLQDPFIQTVTQGSDILHTAIPHLTGAGRWTAVANPYGGNAIRFSNRMNEWDGLDFLWKEFKLPDGDYVIQIIGNIEKEGEFDFPTFTLAGTTSPWGWVGEEEFPDDDGNFDMYREFSISGDNIIDIINDVIGGNLRMRAHDVLNNFTIYQIAVVPYGRNLPMLPPRVAPTPAPTPASTPAPTPVPSNDVSIRLTIGNINANVNGSSMALSDAPFISSEGRTMVPVRFVADAMGATTDWNGATQTVTITPQGRGAINLVVGQALPDDMGTPEIVGGRTFVPVRFVAVRMGGGVDWNAASQTVTITFS
ncbi:MAG: stalk domain-containing protein [Defluviitaleaceae bacterium]|nr:stalk domain-containing protein [Defluviitaleaceae bacterium]